MYDAVTRNTYAELVKTAAAKTPERLKTALVKLAERQPAVRDALVAASATLITSTSVETKEKP